MTTEPWKGAGVRAVLRELRGRQRDYGDTMGGLITSIERAINHGFVVFQDGKFTLTPAGIAYIEACGKEPWLK